MASSPLDATKGVCETASQGIQFAGAGPFDTFLYRTADGVLVLQGTQNAAPSLGIGANPASAGPLALPNNTVIKARNAANSADLSVIGTNASNFIALDPNSNGIQLGANSAQTGELNFANNQTISWRNAGNSADFEGIRVDASGNVILGRTGGLTAAYTVPVFGYGPAAVGVGGAITQLTSRTTGVTLNTPTGAITMFSAAGSATAATFTVTNSQVAATDTIILSQKSGTNLYQLIVTAVAAGSFNITFFTTGGTAVDAPVINFAVIKGQAS